MAIRKHRAGELVIEQTRDLARVREMLARAGMIDGRNRMAGRVLHLCVCRR